VAVDQVSICNSALIKVGAARISSITQDRREAVLLNALWDQQRDYVLRAHKWNFATKRVTLAPTSDEPEFGYDYEYELPTDCLRFLATDPDDIDYVVEANGDGDSRVLRTNESSIDGLYIFRCDNISMWDSCFVEALAWKLAAEIAYPLTQSMTLSDSCFKKYMSILSEARSIDGAEGIMRDLVADTWTNARR
jgi:hypothetical protein